MRPINPEPTFTPDESIQYGDQKLREKAQRDREYREKRLMVAVHFLRFFGGQIDVGWSVKTADMLIRVNEEMAVPE